MKPPSTSDFRLSAKRLSGLFALNLQPCDYARRAKVRYEKYEVSERDVFEAIAAAKGLPLEFADVLRHAIGRNRLRLHRFDLRQCRSFAVGRRRSGKDQALDLQLLCGNQDVQSAINVDLVRLDGGLNGARDGCAGGEMENVLHFVHGIAHDLDVRDAAFNEPNLAADFGEVVFLAGRQVIQNNNAVAAADQFVHRV